MSMVSRAPYLRLVATTESEANGKRSSQKNVSRGQLAFPYPEDTSVFFLFIDGIKPVEFHEIIKDYNPAWIFDTRVVPRLDIIAKSRYAAFHLFAKSKISYVDLFGRLGINSYRSTESNPMFWGEAVGDLIRSSDRKGPYFFLFDDNDLMKSAAELLISPLSAVVGRNISISLLPAN